MMIDNEMQEELNECGFALKPNDNINEEKMVIFVKQDKIFTDEPIKILECIELASKYDLDIDINTKNLIHTERMLLNNVSPKLIYEKLKRIILSNHIDYYMEEFCDIFFVIIPELEKSYNFNQYNDYHIFDVYKHTISVVSHTNSNLYVRLAALFHDMGKPYAFTKDENGVGHFYGHALISNKIFIDFANKYEIDEKTKKIVSDLILFHQDELSKKNSKIYKFYKIFNMDNIELLLELKKADIMGQNPKYINRLERLKLLAMKYLFVRERIRKIDYSKDDLINLGIDNEFVEMLLDDIKYKIITGQLKENDNEIQKYVESKAFGITR